MKRRLASERAVMIRAPMAIAELTIRNLAPLKTGGNAEEESFSQ
jgi:hypothetical protein